MFVSWTQTVAIFEAELENLVRLEPNRPNRSTVKLGAEWVNACPSVSLFYFSSSWNAMWNAMLLQCYQVLIAVVVIVSIILEVSLLCWTRSGSGFFCLPYLDSIP